MTNLIRLSTLLAAAFLLVDQCSGASSGKVSDPTKAKKGKSGKPNSQTGSPSLCDFITHEGVNNDELTYFTLSSLNGLSEKAAKARFEKLCFDYLDQNAPEYKSVGPNVKYFDTKKTEPMTQEGGPFAFVPGDAQIFAGSCWAKKITDARWYDQSVSNQEALSLQQYWKPPTESTADLLQKIGATVVPQPPINCGP